MGKDISLHGLIGDFTESILLVEWDACETGLALQGRSILLNTFIESARASFACLVVFGSIMSRLRFIHTLLLLGVWYVVQYLPLVLWMRNPLGWMNNILHMRDYAGAWHLHAVPGIMALILVMAFPELGRTPDGKTNFSGDVSGANDATTPVHQHHELRRDAVLLDEDDIDANGMTLNDPAHATHYHSLDHPAAAQQLAQKHHRHNAHRIRIKPNNVSRLVFGAWSTFIGLIALAASSHNGTSPAEDISPYRSILLSTVNTALSGLATGLMFYFVFYVTKKRPSLLMFCRGLIVGAVSCSAFAGDTLVLYAIPISCLISLVSYVCFIFMEKIPKLHDATHVVALHGVPGCLSMLTMGFIKEIPSLTDIDDGEILDALLQVAGFLIGVVWCLLTGICIVLVFKFCLRAAVPAQYAARGMDHLYTYEKKEAHPKEEIESDTESEYETYTETFYVSQVEMNSPQHYIGGVNISNRDGTQSSGGAGVINGAGVGRELDEEDDL